MMVALENEVLRNSKPSLDHSFLSPDKLFSSNTSVDRPLLRVRAGLVDVNEAGGHMRGNQALKSDLLDYNMDSVAEAKARLQKLQEEADTLEEAYRAYQQRAVNSTIPPLFPTRPLPSMAHPLHHTINKNIPQAHLPHKTRSSHTSESLQPATTSFSRIYPTMSTVQPGQTRVTSEALNDIQTTVFNDYSAHILAKPLQQSVQSPLEGSSSPPRELSPEFHCGPVVTLQRELSKGTVSLYFSSLSPYIWSQQI